LRVRASSQLPDYASMNSEPESLAKFNVDVHIAKGLSGWRLLYTRILEHIRPESVLEVGSGSPDFLQALEGCQRRVAVDGGDRWQQEFLESGIGFYNIDLDHDPLPELDPFQVSVCSDVFEHLLYPDRTLHMLRTLTTESGVLMSHVPNEFRLAKTLKIMLGRREAKYSHPHCDEYNHPHLRRFTRIGFKKFLEREFKYNLFVSDLRYGTLAGLINRVGIRVPYALEGGPTYLSTNSHNTFERLCRIKRALL
jgi:hypothetical protein